MGKRARHCANKDERGKGRQDYQGRHIGAVHDDLLELGIEQVAEPIVADKL